MRKLFYGLTFWSLYTLGFTVVLPTGLYYGETGYGTPPLESATEAFIYLGLGIVIWSIALIAYTRFYVQAVFLDKRKLEKATESGISIPAKIVDKKQVGVFRKMAMLSLRLSFKNLAGCWVEVPYQLNDSKTFENRFEVGKTIEMRASLDEQHAVFVPRTMQVVRNSGMTVLYSVILLLLLLGAFVYPVFSYWLESNGSGWRFLKFYHPWILVPVINFGVALIIWLIMKTIRGAAGSSSQSLQMVLHGIKTTGQVTSYEQTGTYINEQPQVRFEVEYTDNRGAKHHSSYKKIVSLLDIHRLGTGPVDIMYLPATPHKIVFHEELEL